jgi:hypothetical protein
VSEHVRVQVLAQLAHAGLAYPQLDRAGAEALALTADEHGAILWIGQRAQWQPGVHRFTRLAPDRQLARLVALAAHPHQPGGQVEAVEIETDQLGQAQAGGVEQLEHGLVATGDKIVLHSAIQQLRRTIGIQRARQAALALGRGEPVRRIVPTQAFAAEVLVQAAHRREQAGQRTAGLPLAVQARDHGAQATGIQGVPAGHAVFFAQGEDFQQIATVAVEGVHGDLALAAQVIEKGVEAALHGDSGRRRGGPRAARNQRTERSGAAKPGSTRASTSAT